MTVGMFQKMNQHYGQDPEQAKFFWSGGPVEVAERTWFASFFSGVTGFETDEGLVLVDSGLSLLAPALDQMLRRRTEAPVHTAVFTQEHVDHAFGLSAFMHQGQDPPRVTWPTTRSRPRPTMPTSPTGWRPSTSGEPGRRRA